VGLFFVLSGFVTTRLADRQLPELTYPGYLTFLRGRLERLYPTYLGGLLGIVLLVVGALALGVPFRVASYDWSMLPQEVLMMHHWWPNSYLGWNYPAWSISVLWFILVCVYPYVLLFVRNEQRVSRHWVVVGAVAAAYIVMRPFTDLAGWGQLRVGLPFIIGVFLCVWRDRLVQFPKWINEMLSWGSIVGYLVFHYFFPPIDFLGAAFMLFCMVGFVWGVTWPGSSLARLLSIDWMRKLGAVSYSLYISHAFGHRIIAGAFRSSEYVDSPPYVRLLVLTVYAVLIAAGTVILYYGVERPFERWRREGEVIRRKIAGGARLRTGKDTAPLGGAA
jgi:peptidoglycan/LPS O-acetylase OafA/YrhL